MSNLTDNTGTVEVLHVITGLGIGGAESMLTSLLLAGPEREPPLRQTVVSLLPGGPNARRLKAAGIRVIELNMSPSLSSGWELFRLARLIWLERPRVIQSWMYHADLAATLALYWSGLRESTQFYWGLRCSDMDLRHYGRALRLAIGSCAQLSHLPDAVISNSLAGVAVHRGLGYKPRRTIVIDNGVDTVRFRPDPAQRRLVRDELGISEGQTVAALVARVDPMKDHACFLRAMERLPGVMPMLIGQGTERLLVGPGARALGRRDDVWRLLNAADIIVSSSAFGEGFSNSISEGMATGLPAVVTDVGDARRIVGDTGIVVPPRDPEALAAAISSLLAEPADQRRARGLAARARVEEKFSLDRARRAFAQLHTEGP